MFGHLIIQFKNLQKRLYRTDSSRLIVSQPSPLFIGLLAFHMARRYLISKMEKTTNLKNAAVAKALNRDSATRNKQNYIHRMFNSVTEIAWNWPYWTITISGYAHVKVQDNRRVQERIKFFFLFSAIYPSHSLAASLRKISDGCCVTSSGSSERTDFCFSVSSPSSFPCPHLLFFPLQTPSKCRS